MTAKPCPYCAKPAKVGTLSGRGPDSLVENQPLPAAGIPLWAQCSDARCPLSGLPMLLTTWNNR